MTNHMIIGTKLEVQGFLQDEVLVAIGDWLSKQTEQNGSCSVCHINSNTNERINWLQI